jgi:acetylglutamate kinase
VQAHQPYDQAALIAALLQPARYPQPVTKVDHLQTHISHVLLAGDYAYKIKKAVDLGFVGDPEKVDLTLLNQLIGHELIPVLAPLATSNNGQTLNVNADTFAGAVAGALKAKRLLLLTDVPGVLDKSKKLIPELSVKDARKLIADGTISGGMIPKVETCIYALEQGVQGVVIIDGKTQHAVLLELFTNQGTGTLIHK